MFDPPRILVTGGSGILGQALVRNLVRQGNSVRIISRNANLAQNDKVSVHRGDIARLEDVKSAIHGCTSVFHCAAEKNDLSKMNDTNISGTRILFEAAKDAGVKCFCHVSSVGVIGRTRQTVIDESSHCSPTNFYEETKLAAEQIVKRGLDGGGVVILRPTNIFGAETLLPWLKSSLYSKLRLALIGNERAHLVYVEDVAAAAIFLWLAKPHNSVQTFNVSCDEEHGGTHHEMQELFASTVDIPSRQFAFSAPPLIPYWLRLMKKGVANHGNVVYSSLKLRAAGFRFPFGLQAGLIHAAGAVRQRVQDASAGVP